MATNENLIPIPGRLHSVATEGHVAGADEIYDDALGKTQAQINQESQTLPDNIAYLGDDDGQAVIPDFDPQTDTLHKAAQVLTTAEKDQVAQNLNNRPSTNGMARIELKATDNFKSVVEAQTSGNTVFVIKYDYTLTGDVTVPSNCVLEFDGGSISGNHTITGQNTGINAGLVKIFDTNVILAGSWNVAKAYPEWFGAKGDGVTDDTLAIRKVCLFKNSKIIFSDKIYIINIEAGSDNTTSRTFFGGSSASNHYEGIGNATIKLGKDNGDTRIFKGFEAIFWLSGDRDYIFENITFDYNYAENPIYQYTSDHVGVEVNGQLVAIFAYHAASLRVNNCKFIEPSGTNTVSMRGSATSDHLLYEVTNCQFIRVGNKSFYQTSDHEAYHDVSTLGCHAATGGNPNAKLYANVSNNIAIGVGGNAFDFCECSAEEFIFDNNNIENYQIGVMPLGHKDTIAKITNNTFYKVARAVGMWFNCDGYTLSATDYSYQLLLIDGNQVTIDFDGRLRTPNYNTVNNKQGDYYLPSGSTRFALLNQMQLATNPVKDIVISNNTVRYLDYSNVPSSVFNLFGNETIMFMMGDRDTLLTLDRIIIKNNSIDNPNAGIFRNACFTKLKELQLVGNTITNVWGNSNSSEIKDGLMSTNAFGVHPHDRVIITDNMVTQSENQIAVSKPVVFCYVGNVDSETLKYVLFSNNRIGFVFSEDIGIDGADKVDYINEYITSTANRPQYGSDIVGAKVFDTTLGKPIYWNGTAWVDATGATV